MLEVQRRNSGPGRTRGHDSIWLARGCLAAGDDAGGCALRAECKGRRKYPGEMEFNGIDPIGQEVERRRAFRNHRLRRGIYLLPSALTVANMLCGYYAVLATVEGSVSDFDYAACAI